jgi:hypothetical protein
MIQNKKTFETVIFVKLKKYSSCLQTFVSFYLKRYDH